MKKKSYIIYLSFVIVAIALVLLFPTMPDQFKILLFTVLFVLTSIFLFATRKK